MAFSSFQLDKNLLRGIKELGFVRPTPIQADAIPPAIEGRDVLACASTGSGKTAAFLLPILNRLLTRPRGKTRALVITPTRELASQILEQFNALATHTPLTGAVVIGGVGMGPQEHAFRTGVDVIVATPGRLLDHLKAPYAKLDTIEHLVLDEADRMLDMGFLPDIRRLLRFLPPKRQTLFFSATMPGPIGVLAREMLHNPAAINLERTAKPAVGITQAVYPVPQEMKASLLFTLLERGQMAQALVFTRTKHRTNRLYEYLLGRGIKVERIHGNRSQPQRTAALAGFKDGTHRVLVATDIAARGIDVEALGHVVNFDVPLVADDYIHRVGRTGRAELTGEAFTFVSPEEEPDLRQIEKAISRRLPRVTVPDFDYAARPQARFEVPAAERIAAIRARKSEERARAKAKLERKTANEASRQAGARTGMRQPQQPSGQRPAPQSSGQRPASPSSSGPSQQSPQKRDAPRSGGRRGSRRPYR